MKKYLLKDLAIIHTVSVLLLIGGCTSQTKKPKVPAPLEKEIKSIEDSKSGKISQPYSPEERATYTVKKGDTLWRISKNYGVSVETILRTNHISDIKDLKIGQKLIIPTSEKPYTSLTSYPDHKPIGNIPGNISSSSFIWPVKGQIVSKFGEPRDGTKNMGICILPQPDQKIVAAKRGIVEVFSPVDTNTCVLIIKHDGGVRTIYGGNCNPMVGEGSYVEQGQPIANISQTSTGSTREINFKIYIKDKPVNPLSYLP